MHYGLPLIQKKHKYPIIQEDAKQFVARKPLYTNSPKVAYHPLHHDLIQTNQKYTSDEYLIQIPRSISVVKKDRVLLPELAPPDAFKSLVKESSLTRRLLIKRFSHNMKKKEM